MQKEIIERIAQAFEANQEVELFHTTSDGQCFVKRNEASIHARSLADGSITPITRGMLEKAATVKQVEGESKKLSVEERMAKVESASTIEELEALLKGETAKTVKVAIDAKIEGINRNTIIDAILLAETVEAIDKLVDGSQDEEIIKAAEARKQELE